MQKNCFKEFPQKYACSFCSQGIIIYAIIFFSFNCRYDFLKTIFTASFICLRKDTNKLAYGTNIHKSCVHCTSCTDILRWHRRYRQKYFRYLTWYESWMSLLGQIHCYNGKVCWGGGGGTWIDRLSYQHLPGGGGGGPADWPVISPSPPANDHETFSDWCKTMHNNRVVVIRLHVNIFANVTLRQQGEL
jgi:hypothetical protein